MIFHFCLITYLRCSNVGTNVHAARRLVVTHIGIRGLHLCTSRRFFKPDKDGKYITLYRIISLKCQIKENRRASYTQLFLKTLYNSTILMNSDRDFRLVCFHIICPRGKFLVGCSCTVYSKTRDRKLVVHSYKSGTALTTRSANRGTYRIIVTEGRLLYTCSLKMK